MKPILEYLLSNTKKKINTDYYSDLLNQSKKANKKCIDFLDNDNISWLTNIFKKMGQKYIDKIPDDINIEDCAKDSKTTTLRDYRGYEGRFGTWQDGYFNRNKSCWHDTDDKTVKDLKDKIDNSEKKIDMLYFQPLFVTWCEHLESVGFDDPAVEWTVGDFRGAENAMQIILKMIKETT